MAKDVEMKAVIGGDSKGIQTAFAAAAAASEASGKTISGTLHHIVQAVFSFQLPTGSNSIRIISLK